MSANSESTCREIATNVANDDRVRPRTTERSIRDSRRVAALGELVRGRVRYSAHNRRVAAKPAEGMFVRRDQRANESTRAMRRLRAAR